MDEETFERLLQKQVEGKLSAAEEIQLQQAYGQLLNEEIAAGGDDATLVFVKSVVNNQFPGTLFSLFI